MTIIVCTPVSLPDDQLVAAAQDAIRINPANAPTDAAMAMVATALAARDVAPGDDAVDILTPQKLAVLVSKYWGTGGVKLTVGFMDGPTPSLREKILLHMNAWGQRSNVKFVYTGTDPQVRISRGSGGYWSYLGTDVLRIARNQQTMNLEGFTDRTEEREFFRVVRHETGHTLGFPHEHLRKELVNRLDPAKTIAYFRRIGWDEQTTRSNVLTALEDRQINATPLADQTSIMAYQLPGEITRDGQPIVGGTDINELDYQFANKIYPLAEPPPPPPPAGHKVYVSTTPPVTAASVVASGGNLVLTLANDPGSVTLAVKSTTGGTGMNWLTKILALWTAIRAGDWATVFEILGELGRAQAAGQLSGAEGEAVGQMMQQACDACKKE